MFGGRIRGASIPRFNQFDVTAIIQNDWRPFRHITQKGRTGHLNFIPAEGTGIAKYGWIYVFVWGSGPTMRGEASRHESGLEIALSRGITLAGLVVFAYS